MVVGTFLSPFFFREELTIKKIEDAETKVYREGKNWYIEAGQTYITVNAHSYTIITAHKKSQKEY